MDDFTQAGKGLRTLLIAEILLLLSSLIPVLGLIGMCVGFLLCLTGLKMAGEVHPHFKLALMTTVLNVAVHLAALFLPQDDIPQALAAAATILLGFLTTYLICTAAAALVEQRGDFQLAQRGRFVWKLVLVCGVASAAGALLGALPPLAAMLLVPLLLIEAATLVSGVLYLVFLLRAYRYLLA